MIDTNKKLKPTVKVWDSVGLGLIINYPTGILISNQTGGNACLQSLIEGIYLPLCNDYNVNTYQLISPEIELKQYFLGEKHKGMGATNGIDKNDAECINHILSKFGLHNFIEIDIERFQQSHEAWIYVNIYPNMSHTDLLSYFSSKLKGVLTWSNSD